MKITSLLVAIVVLVSCTHRNNINELSKYEKDLKKDLFPYQGNYVWKFDLMGGEQVSTHTLYPDSVVYQMSGNIYSTRYNMKKLSYDKDINKWIGEDENRIVYVLFFKDKTDSTITIYKHKCKSKGLEEALQFGKPAPDATEDHGWNVYSLNGYYEKEQLPITGNFSNGSASIFLSDSLVRFAGKEVQKISFHKGERRWVGKYQNQYLQIFFKSLAVTNSIQIAMAWSNNLETLYLTKYESITNWTTYDKL